MNEAPHNTLPSAEQIRIAINTWFRGGGWTNLIVAVLRREQATLDESQDVAEKIAKRLNDGLHIVTDGVVSDSLEMVRAVAAHHQTRRDEEAKSPNPPIGSDEWHRRATAMAARNSWAENPYKTWQWEKPAKQRRSL